MKKYKDNGNKKNRMWAGPCGGPVHGSAKILAYGRVRAKSRKERGIGAPSGAPDRRLYRRQRDAPRTPQLLQLFYFRSWARLIWYSLFFSLESFMYFKSKHFKYE